MTQDVALTSVRASRLPRRQRTQVLSPRLDLARHAPGIAVLLALSLWLTRHWFTSSSLPAGTDMLGFVSRAEQNAHGLEAVRLWSPTNWGAPRAITLESLLGVITSMTGDPVLAVKLFAAATLFASGVFTYLLAYRWFRSRFAGCAAGLLYMSSQGVVSHWASGHLNVEVAIATMPLMLMLWCESVERFSPKRSVALGVAAAMTILARPDLVLYVVPALVVFVIVRLTVAPRASRTLQNTVLTAAVGVATTLALSLYLILPSLAGIRARWLTSTSLFDTKQLVARSVGAYPSLLGFAREIGYLAFTGQETWTTHPWVTFSRYAGAATVVVVLAYGSLFVRRDARVLALAATGVLVTFMAKGLRAPLGGPFRFAVLHVPVFSNLRDPNRWLLPQGLVYAMLAGATLAALADHVRRPLAKAAAGVLLTVALVPVAPTVLTGFRTVSLTRAQTALLDRVAQDHRPSLVATVPYDQTYRFVSEGSYRGWEHDLGNESAAYTGHAAIGDGGWDQQAADTVAFTATLLRNRDPAFARILGSLGTRYVLSFGYAPTAPHLRDSALGRMYQQRFIARMPGLSRVASADSATLYSIGSFAPLVSFRPNIAVVLGGRDGLAALADQPGIDLRSWAVFTADDVLAHGGVSRLFDLARRARLLVVSNTTPKDLAVLASPPVASLFGITSDAGLDQESQIVPSDASIRLGSLASESVPPAQINRTATAASFQLQRSRPLELWARVETSPTAARLTFTIDGRRVASLEPLTAVGGGFRWYRIAQRNFTAGRHTLGLRTASSPFGSDYEIDEARLVDPTSRRMLTIRFARLLGASARRTLYSYVPAELQHPLTPGDLASTAVPVSRGREFWRILERRRVSSTPTRAGVELRIRPRRRFHTLIQHTFGRALDWSGFDHVLLRFKGTGDGARYRLIVDFTRTHADSSSFTFTDRPGWRRVGFATLADTASRGHWSHVVSVRLASDSLDAAARLTVGSLRATRAAHGRLALPVAPVTDARRVRIGAGRFGEAAGSSTLSVPLSPRLLASSARVTVSPPGRIAQLPPVPVSFTRSGDGYRFRMHSRHPGVLVLAQAYDSHWHAHVGGNTVKPMSVLALTNGYLIGSGAHAGTISFGGDYYGALGAGLSVLGLLAVCGGAWRFRGRKLE